MPREGLTSELRRGPSPFRTAVLNESINAATCGSVQMVEEPDGAVRPGVTAPGVCKEGSRVGVAMKSVGVRVTAGANGVAGEAQPASRINPRRNVDRILVFMLISSFFDYIPREES
jgi:hypothetical protein